MRSPLTNSAISNLSRIGLVALVAISLVLMTIYAREGESGPLHGLQGAVSSVVAPLGFVGAATSSAVSALGENVDNLTADESTLSALRAQNQQLRALAAQNEEYRQEALRLQGLLNMSDRFSAEGVSGHIVGRSTDAWNQTITVDVGSENGVEAGMTVLSSAGVIGHVATVSPYRSVIRLLTDPASGAAALLQSSRAEGIVRGSLDGLLYLENINSDVEVQPGDVVVTSGLGGSYVSGLLIGAVARVEGSRGDAARRILVAPNASVSTMEEVTIVFEPKTFLNQSSNDSTSDASVDSGGDS